jgi:hypothetical protein
MPLVKSTTQVVNLTSLTALTRGGGVDVVDCGQAVQITVTVKVTFGAGSPEPVLVEVYSSTDGVTFDTVPFIQSSIPKQTGEASSQKTISVPAGIEHASVKVYNSDSVIATGAIVGYLTKQDAS